MSDFPLIHEPPDARVYNALRASVGWDVLDPKTTQEALQKSSFTVCVYDEDRLIGFGRIVGDGALYFYIQDVMIHPTLQRQGLGTRVMGELMQYLQKAENGSFIGLMAVPGTERFYESFDFQALQCKNTAMGIYVCRD